MGWTETTCTACKGPAIGFDCDGGGTHFRHGAGASSKWHWTQGSPGVLYLPDGAPREGATLHLVEGETDAEALHAVGLPVAGVIGAGRARAALDRLDELGLLGAHREVVAWREPGGHAGGDGKPASGGYAFAQGARAGCEAHGVQLRIASWPLDEPDARALMARVALAHAVKLSADGYDGALSHLKLCAAINAGHPRVAQVAASMRERLEDLARDAVHAGAASVEVVDTATASRVGEIEVPRGWRLSDRMGVEFDGGDRGFVRILPVPLVIDCVEVDSADGRERLALRWKHRGSDHFVSMPREDAASSRAIVQYARTGLPVTSENAKGVVRWLHALEHQQGAQLPRAFVARRSGWALGQHVHRVADMSIDESTGSGRLLSGLVAAGDADESEDFVRRVVEQHPMAACMLAASLAASLLHPLRLRGFALHLWGDSRGGKALDLDTPLPTPTGWTTMGEVATGDTLIDEQGRPCRVVKAHDVLHGRDCYEVEFSDGETIVADGDHLWQTSTPRERIAAVRKTPEWRARRQATRGRSKGTNPAVAAANARRAKDPVTIGVRTTTEIMADTERGIRHAVDVAKPLDLPDVDLPIDPYILGVWLGDGTSANGSFTTEDVEVVQSFRDAGFDVRKLKDRYGWGARGLHRPLRMAGLLGNKHIPAAYLRASVAQRVALLQGIVDSDGHIDHRGQVEVGLARKPLMDGVHELLLSLGIKCRVRESRATINGRDCGPVWRVKFLTDIAAARLPRKLARQKRAGFKGTHARRYIVAIRPVASRPVRCVTVDSPSRLYLAGRAMIPTHNTAALKLALSLWGDPMRLMGSWSATSNAIEAHAATLCDLPCALDELQAARSVEHVAQTIYALANGLGRARATVTGDLGAQRAWRTVVLTTGEMPLLPDDAHDGARTRTIDIHAAPFAGEYAAGDAAAAHDLAERAYGHIGPAFLSGALLSPANRSLLRGEHEGACDALAARVRGDVPPIKLRSAGAMVMALHWLIEHVGAGQARPAADIVAAMMSVAAGQAEGDDSHGSMTWKAAQAIVQLVAERRSDFEPGARVRLGRVDVPEPGVLTTERLAWLTVPAMKLACEQAGVPYRRGRELLHAAGVLPDAQAAMKRGVLDVPARLFRVSLDRCEEVER